MTYTHLTTDELIIIESYHHQSIPVAIIAERLKRCGRRKISLPKKEQEYVKEKVALGWIPDVIIGRAEQPISCSMRTLYRLFEDGDFDKTTLPVKGKRKPNGYKERRGK